MEAPLPNSVAKLPLPPEVEGNMIFTKIIPLVSDFLGWLERYRDEMGNVYYAKLISMDICVVCEPEWVQYVMQQNNRNYEKSFGYEILALFLGQGLLTSDGDFWLRQRRMAQPAFHRERLNGLVKHMIEESREMALEWKRRAAYHESFNVMDDMMKVTMKIVARGLFSANVAEDIETISYNLERLNQFATTRIQSPIRLPMWLPTLKNLVFRQTCEELNDVLFRIIEERRKDPNPPGDLLTMLMEAKDKDTGEGMSDAQLRDECMTIFVAGHETTAVSMTWLWYELGKNAEVMAKLKAELVEVLGERQPEIEDIPRLKYTRMIINEILRLYPPGWLLGRRALEDDTINGYHIPKGTNVLLFTYGIHRRPDLWERPDDFWPERWETERVKELEKMAYFPFGGGPRLCIGNNFALMEMTILVATLAQDFEPRFVGEEAPKVVPLITLRPKGKVEIAL